MKATSVILFLLLIIGNCSFAQNDTINQRDPNGKKQGYWIYYGKDRPGKGYPDSVMIEAGPYVNDRKEGLWKRYNIDGSIRIQGVYENNRPSSYHPNSPYQNSMSCTSEVFDSIVVQKNYANMTGPIIDTSVTIYPSQDHLVAYVDSLSKLDETFQSSPFRICSHSLYIEIKRYVNGSMCSAKYNTCDSKSDAAKIARECEKKVFHRE